MHNSYPDKYNAPSILQFRRLPIQFWLAQALENRYRVRQAKLIRLGLMLDEPSYLPGLAIMHLTNSTAVDLMIAS